MVFLCAHSFKMMKNKKKKPNIPYRSIHEPWEPGMDYVPEPPQKKKPRKPRANKEKPLIPAASDINDEIFGELEWRRKQVEKLHLNNRFLKWFIFSAIIVLIISVVIQSTASLLLFLPLTFVVVPAAVLLGVYLEKTFWENKSHKDYAEYKKQALRDSSMFFC